MPRGTDGFFDQPRQIYPLALVSLWHVAAYAGLIGHLVLFITASPGEYGYGWTGAEAVRLYGLFTGLVQSSPLLGGWIADAFIGKRRTAILGMWLQTLAIFALAGLGTLPAMLGSIYDAPVRQVILEAEVPIARLWLDDAETARVTQAVASHADGPAAAESLQTTVNTTYGAMTLWFYGSLFIFVTGFGLQSPTLAAMVGPLYEGTRGKREGGYTLMFMAGMLGFIIGALISGTIASSAGWVEGLASAGVMMALAAIILTRVRLPISKIEDTSGEAGVRSYRFSLTQGERRRIAAICALCLAYFVFVAAFDQWGGSFSLYVQNTSDRVVAGFEIPTLWIHSAQALFVIIVGPIMLAIWSRLEGRGLRLTAPTKMAIGLLLTTCAFLIMSGTLPSRGGDLVTKTSLAWPLTYYWVITFGQMAVVPVGLAFVSREAPRRLASTMMGAWLLFGGVGIWLSGQIGALTEPFGIRAVYLGIAACTALAAAATLSFRDRLMSLLGE